MLVVPAHVWVYDVNIGIHKYPCTVLQTFMLQIHLVETQRTFLDRSYSDVNFAVSFLVSEGIFDLFILV